MACQVFLPGFAIADLRGLRETVSIRIDAHFPVGIENRSSGAVGLGGLDARTLVDTPWHQRVSQDIAHIRIELGPGGTTKKSIYVPARNRRSLNVLFE